MYCDAMGLTEFGDFVRNRRRELGLKQHELADLVGVTHQHISGIERGKTKQPENDTLQKLAHALKVKPQVIGAFIGMYQDGVDEAGTVAYTDLMTPDQIWTEFVRRFNGDEHAAREALLQTLQRSFPR